MDNVHFYRRDVINKCKHHWSMNFLYSTRLSTRVCVRVEKHASSPFGSFRRVRLLQACAFFSSSCSLATERSRPCIGQRHFGPLFDRADPSALYRSTLVRYYGCRCYRLGRGPNTLVFRVGWCWNIGIFHELTKPHRVLRSRGGSG
jgi:hypothetical protein